MHQPCSDPEHDGTGPAVVVPDERQPWLDEVESAAWSSLMQVLHLLPQQLDRQLRDTAGVTHSYYTILSALSDAPDRELPHSALAQAVGSSPSRVSHAVDALCGRNWLERRRCEQDRRVHYARLTEQGARALAVMAPGHVAEVRRTVLDRLSRAELVLLHRLATTIAEPLSADVATSVARTPDAGRPGPGTPRGGVAHPLEVSPSNEGQALEV